MGAVRTAGAAIGLEASSILALDLAAPISFSFVQTLMPVVRATENGRDKDVLKVAKQAGKMGKDYGLPVGIVAAVIAILTFLSGIQGDLADLKAGQDSNCKAISGVATGVIGVTAVDNELNRPRNQALRESLIRQLRTTPVVCSGARDRR